MDKMTDLVPPEMPETERSYSAVKRNKKQRCFLHQSLKGSPGYVWDHQPVFDGSKQYVRGGVNKTVAC